MSFTSVFNQMLSSAQPNRFEKEFSLLDKYITDDVKRNNMLHNEELKEIYNKNKSTIKFFLLELERHYDIETTKHIVESTILKMPENILVSFMISYLNSSEVSKSNTDVLSFYNKIQQLGPEAVRYVEENGIITNRKYTNLPIQIIEQKYEAIKTGTESFKGELLDDYFKSLTPEEKVFVYHLVESKSFGLLEQLFAGNNYGLQAILRILSSHKIDDQIINFEVYNELGLQNMYTLILLILDTTYYETVLNNLYSLINTKRFTLINKLVETGLISSLYRLNVNQVMELNDREIFESLAMSNKIYLMDAVA